MKEVLEGILEAIEEEKAAQQKYKRLKEQSDNKKAKALFDQLIKDEVEHERLLRSRYEALKSRVEDEEGN
ncbi:MAG: ferritin family protein [Bacillota bacterium]